MSVETPAENVRRSSLVPAAAVYTLAVVYGSLVPLYIRPITFDDAIATFSQLRYVELALHGRADWVANLLLFVPMGFLWMGALGGNARRRGAGLMCLLPTIVLCAAFSVALEFAQVWFWPRTVSQNDIIAEVLGSVLGALVWVGCGEQLVRWWVHRGGESRADWYLQLYLVGLVAFSLFPMDFLIRPTEIQQKYAEGKLHFMPFADFRLEPAQLWYYARHVLAFIPVGLLLASRATRQDGAGRHFGRNLLLGAAIVVGIELCQVLVYSRRADASHVVTGIAGVAAGVWLRRKLPALEGASRNRVWLLAESRRRQALWLGAAAAYGLCLAAMLCWPYDFRPYRIVGTDKPDYFWRVPFAALYWGTELGAATAILRQTLLFAPLGALLGAALTRPRRAYFTAAAAIVIGGATECGQIFLPAHNSDVTDVLLGVAGALAGVHVAPALTIRSSSDKGRLFPGDACLLSGTAAATSWSRRSVEVDQLVSCAGRHSNVVSLLRPSDTPSGSIKRSNTARNRRTSCTSCSVQCFQCTSMFASRVLRRMRSNSSLSSIKFSHCAE